MFVLKEISSGELKNIIIEQVDSMETSLAHLVPEFTANLVGSILLLGYMLRERDRYRVRKRVGDRKNIPNFLRRI